jgi:transposase
MSSSLPPRFVALDIRKRSAMVGAVDAARRVALKPRPVALGELERWLRQNLQPTDAVVIDSPTNTWQLHDQIAPLVASVTIAHPQLASLLPTSADHADPRDTLNLARMHAAGLVPALWVPPAHARDLRALAAHRRRLLNQRADARTTLHDTLRRYRLQPPGRDRLSADRLDWWETAGLARDDLERVRASFVALNRVEPLLADVEARLARLGAEAPWQDTRARLMCVPGMSALSAAILLAAIGEIERFPTAGQLVGYAGLAGPNSDGAKGEAGESGKDGRREIRSAMLEVAWDAVRDDAEWRATFEKLELRVGRGRAIVATARKLLIVVWETLTAPAGARGADDPLEEIEAGQVRRAA